MHGFLRYLDPRRSLASAIGWLVFALSIGLALVATVWVDAIVRADLLDQPSRQLERTAERVTAELDLNLALRMRSVHTLAVMLSTELRPENRVTLRNIFENLQQASPEFAWIGVANRQGRVLAATQDVLEGASVTDRSWFVRGLKRSNIGEVLVAPEAAQTPPAASTASPGSAVDLIAPVIGARGTTLGVIGTQLNRRWLLDLAEKLGRQVRGSTDIETLLLDREGTVRAGPEDLKGTHWESAPEATDPAVPTTSTDVSERSAVAHARVERLTDGTRALVARTTPGPASASHSLGWRILVFQPLQGATQPATVLQTRISIVLLGLGLLAALLGIVLAQRVTYGLEAIARSADGVRSGAMQGIAVPPGRNEAARLGRALSELLTSLQRERSELQRLNAELDQRVSARTREIERLADETRYVAVARERLRIARDLHDTLAHSMMAMVTEIRLLKRLAASDPGALGEELRRAEEAAHLGLREARTAITQLRFNSVRDTGLAAALDDLAKAFVERTGIPVDYRSDARPGTFADERAETLYRIAEEALRNIERHAGATRVTISLHELSDGRGLTLTIADDGAGFDAQAAYPGHYGLAGLHEQAQLIGASLTIHTAPQQGTTVSLTLASNTRA